MLDTHAGTGLYDLSGMEAQKTGEHHSGICKLFGSRMQSELLTEYVRQIVAFNSNDSLRFYPGSPSIAAAMVRPQDRGVFCELHEDDAATLRRTLHGRSNVAVHNRDGYEAIGAFLPPREKRALVLIDPPFEAPTELLDAAAALRKAHARLPQAVLALWYPIKERPALWRFQEEMIASEIRRQLVIEFLTRDEGDSRFLNGSGMLLINPPYGLDSELRPALEELRDCLAPNGKVVIQIQVGE